MLPHGTSNKELQSVTLQATQWLLPCHSSPQIRRILNRLVIRSGCLLLLLASGNQRLLRLENQWVPQ